MNINSPEYFDFIKGLEDFIDKKVTEFNHYHLEFEKQRECTNYHMIKSNLKIEKLFEFKRDLIAIEQEIEKLSIVLNRKSNEIRNCLNEVERLQGIRDVVLNFLNIKEKDIIVQIHFGRGDNIGRDKSIT